MNQASKRYDLEERTAKFSEELIVFLKTLTLTPFNRRIIEQLIGSAGSIGANYCEATEGESKKDFTHKIGIAKKETKETKHWLRLLAKAEPSHKETLGKFWSEASQLLLIFSKIFNSSRKKAVIE